MANIYFINSGHPVPLSIENYCIPDKVNDLFNISRRQLYDSINESYKEDLFEVSYTNHNNNFSRYTNENAPLNVYSDYLQNENMNTLKGQTNMEYTYNFSRMRKYILGGI